MQMKVRVEKGEIKIDVEELFTRLSKVDKKKVYRTIIFDELLVECVVKMIVEGEVEWDNADWQSPDYDEELDINNYWYIGSSGFKTALEEIRRQLLTSKDKIIKRIVADLVHERDRAIDNQQYYFNKMMELERHWRDTTHFNSEYDYPEYPKKMTEEQVSEWIKNVVEKAEKIE